MTHANWTQSDPGTLRWADYAVLKLGYLGEKSYVAARLTENGWELFQPLGCDSAADAKALCERAAWSADVEGQ